MKIEIDSIIHPSHPSTVVVDGWPYDSPVEYLQCVSFGSQREAILSLDMVIFSNALQHPEVAGALIATKDEVLVCAVDAKIIPFQSLHISSESFGKALMELRRKLRQSMDTLYLPPPDRIFLRMEGEVATISKKVSNLRHGDILHRPASDTAEVMNEQDGEKGFNLIVEEEINLSVSSKIADPVDFYRDAESDVHIIHLNPEIHASLLLRVTGLRRVHANTEVWWDRNNGGYKIRTPYSSDFGETAENGDALRSQEIVDLNADTPSVYIDGTTSLEVDPTMEAARAANKLLFEKAHAMLGKLKPGKRFYAKYRNGCSGAELVKCDFDKFRPSRVVAVHATLGVEDKVFRLGTPFTKGPLGGVKLWFYKDGEVTTYIDIEDLSRDVAMDKKFAKKNK